MRGRGLWVVGCGVVLAARFAAADSVNSPNITLNVDTNRSTGPGAGNVAVAINTITLAEISLPEYGAGSGQAILLAARPGYQFDPTSPVSAQSATIGFNGGAINVAASVTPTGAANEVLTFTLTSGTNTSVQDIIRINGLKVKILDAAGAVGPAQTTMSVTTVGAGGAFTEQGIAAANIAKGAADRLVFGAQPGSNGAGIDLLPAVRIVDFGGNTVTNDARTIALALQDNPGPATLLGAAALTTTNGLAEWTAGEHLRIGTAAVGYTLRASHDGAPFLTSDTVDSDPFDILAGPPGHLEITTQPVSTPAGESLLVAVTALDEFDNPVLATPVPVTLDLGTSPTGAPLLVRTSLTKDTVNGVATWDVVDGLRINAAGSGYRLVASGSGAPVDSDEFDVVAAAPNATHYVQQPTDVAAGERLDPPVQVEVVDAFGNRTDATADVELSLFESPCGGSLSGGTATAVDGLATFNNLTFNVPCEGNVLKAAAPALGWAESNTFAVTGTSRPVALKAATMKPGQLSVVAAGPIALPDPTENPTEQGGILTVTGASGRVQHNLPAEAWKGLGAGGSKGFRFSGSVCNVVLKANAIKAACSKTGTLALPENGPLQVVLSIGTSTRYCGACGGTPKGNATKVFKRRACALPAACP